MAITLKRAFQSLDEDLYDEESKLVFGLVKDCFEQGDLSCYLGEDLDRVDFAFSAADIRNDNYSYCFMSRLNEEEQHTIIIIRHKYGVSDKWVFGIICEHLNYTFNSEEVQESFIREFFHVNDNKFRFL